MVAKRSRESPDDFLKKTDGTVSFLMTGLRSGLTQRESRTPNRARGSPLCAAQALSRVAGALSRVAAPHSCVAGLTSHAACPPSSVAAPHGCVAEARSRVAGPTSHVAEPRTRVAGATRWGTVSLNREAVTCAREFASPSRVPSPRHCRPQPTRREVIPLCCVVAPLYRLAAPLCCLAARPDRIGRLGT